MGNDSSGPTGALDDRDDDSVASIDPRFVELARTGRRSLRNELVLEHEGLASAIAADYAPAGETRRDLKQAALLALVKAVDRFDPDRGVPFGAWASRVINGELKRNRRDQSWTVRPPRALQELALEVRRVSDDLAVELGRSPTPARVAAELGIDEDEVLKALVAGEARRADSLDLPAGSSASAEPAVDDAEHGRAELRIAVDQMLQTLEADDAAVVKMRFVDDLSQAEIADRIGVSQMQVSRILRRVMRVLRARLEGQP